jgi:hypothetical protein
MTMIIQGNTYHWADVGECVHDIGQEVEDMRCRGWVLADKIRSAIDQFHVGQPRHLAIKFYDDLIEHTNLSRQTLQNLASVAKKFPPDERSEALSISHHVALLGIVDDDQLDYLMDEAESKGLSVRTVRAMAHAPVAVHRTTNGEYVADEEPPFANREFYEEQGVRCPHCGGWVPL